MMRLLIPCHPPLPGMIKEVSTGPMNSSRVSFPFPLSFTIPPRTFIVASSIAHKELEYKLKNDDKNTKARRSFRMGEIYMNLLYLKPSRNANILQKNG